MPKSRANSSGNGGRRNPGYDGNASVDSREFSEVDSRRGGNGNSSSGRDFEEMRERFKKELIRKGGYGNSGNSNGQSVHGEDYADRSDVGVAGGRSVYGDAGYDNQGFAGIPSNASIHEDGYFDRGSNGDGRGGSSRRGAGSVGQDNLGFYGTEDEWSDVSRGSRSSVGQRSVGGSQSNQGFKLSDLGKKARKQMKYEIEGIYKPKFLQRPIVRGLLAGGGVAAVAAALSLALGFTVPIIGPLLGVIFASVGAASAIGAGISAYREAARHNHNKSGIILNRVLIEELNGRVESQRLKDNNYRSKVNATRAASQRTGTRTNVTKSSKGDRKATAANWGVSAGRAPGSNRSASYVASGRDGRSNSGLGSSRSASLQGGSSHSSYSGSSSGSFYDRSSSENSSRDYTSKYYHGASSRRKLRSVGKRKAKAMAKKLRGYCYWGAVPKNPKCNCEHYTSRTGGWDACSNQRSFDSGSAYPKFGLTGVTGGLTSKSYSKHLVGEIVDGIYRLVDVSTEDIARRDLSNLKRREHVERGEGWGNKWDISTGGSKNHILVGNKDPNIVRAVRITDADSSRDYMWLRNGDLVVKYDSSDTKIQANLRYNRGSSWKVDIYKPQVDGSLELVYNHKQTRNNTGGVLEVLRDAVECGNVEVKNAMMSTKFYNRDLDILRKQRKGVMKQGGLDGIKSRTGRVTVRVR